VAASKASFPERIMKGYKVYTICSGGKYYLKSNINGVTLIEGVIRGKLEEVPKNTFKIKSIATKSTPMPDSETARKRRKYMGRLEPPVMTYLTVILGGHKNTPLT
jgi:hypothetical protein